MVAFFLSAVLLSLYGRERLSTLAGTSSIVVKLLSAPFLFVLTVGQIRRSSRPLRELTIRAVLAVLATLAVYQCFGRDPLLIVHQMTASNTPGWSVSTTVSGGVLLGLAVLMIVTAFLQDGTAQRYVTSSVPTAVYAAALIGYIGLSWYIFVPVALISLVREARAVASTIAISLLLSIRSVQQNVNLGTLHAVLPRPVALALPVLLIVLALLPSGHVLMLKAAGKPLQE